MPDKDPNLINKLVGNNVTASQTIPTTKKSIDNENHVLITANRVVWIRYKVYALFLVIICALGGYYYLYPMFNDYKDIKTDLQQLESQTSIFEARKNKYLEEKSLIQKIQTQEKSIIDYFNKDKGYDQLDPLVQNNIDIVRSYLQLTSLYNPKMFVNETVILANINEYLLKWGSRTKNGDINKIEIGEPEPFENKLYHLPIKINVTFDNKVGLLSFIDNVENKILPDPNYRILYKINEIAYDVVNYKEEQDVEVSLSVYYFR